MDFIEVTGKDVNDAIINAAQKLETPSNELEYEVLESGSNGFLGMFAKPAKIKVRKKTEAEIEAAKEIAVQDIKPKTEEKKPVVKNDDTQEEVKHTVKKDVSEEQVSQVVKKFLGDVFRAMEMEVSIEVSFDPEEEAINVDLSGDEMGLLIGKRGQTLDSLQCILKNVVNKEIGGHFRIKIDTENYRKRREETLASLANNIAAKVKRTRTPVELEAMRSYERRIIHSTLQDNRYVETKSEGEEPYRHVVVYPKKNAYYSSGSYNNKRYNKPYHKNYNNKGYNKNYKNREYNNAATQTGEAAESNE
jgi:spoIIIJ-associated protein